mmetsp:Transcript_10532/g.24759  ORF Transcript_10532/g.24759 Transcript_10532/m.24759 type:complete len:266 (+) Transcript_10532:1746-2543(+)
MTSFPRVVPAVSGVSRPLCARCARWQRRMRVVVRKRADLGLGLDLQAPLQKRSRARTTTPLFRGATIQFASLLLQVQVRPPRHHNSMPIRSRPAPSRPSSNARCRSGWSRSDVRPTPRRRCWCGSSRITRRSLRFPTLFGGTFGWKRWRNRNRNRLVVAVVAGEAEVQRWMCRIPSHLLKLPVPVSAPVLLQQAQGPSDAGRCFEARVLSVMTSARRSLLHRRSSATIPRPLRSSKGSTGLTFASFACTCRSTMAMTRSTPIPVP